MNEHRQPILEPGLYVYDQVSDYQTTGVFIRTPNGIACRGSFNRGEIVIVIQTMYDYNEELIDPRNRYLWDTVTEVLRRVTCVTL